MSTKKLCDMGLLVATQVKATNKPIAHNFFVDIIQPPFFVIFYSIILQNNGSVKKVNYRLFSSFVVF